MSFKIIWPSVYSDRYSCNLIWDPCYHCWSWTSGSCYYSFSSRSSAEDLLSTDPVLSKMSQLKVVEVKNV